MEKRNEGMKVELGKLMPKEWLEHAGVKGAGVPATGVIDAGNDANLALLAIALDGKPFAVTLEPQITMMNFPLGSNSYFPVVKFVLRKGSKIGKEFVTARDKVLEFEHWKGKDKDGVWKEMRPSTLKADEVVKGALTALNEKLFPKSDLTDRPIPETDWSAKLVRDFHIAPDKIGEIARMIRETPGMTWQSMYIAYANAKKA